MDEILIDNLVVLSAIIYYAFLCIVYLLRAYGRDKLELMFAPVFSVLLIPFTALWILNLLNESDIGRLITGFPIIIYFVYDLWHRLITKKKPQHHPRPLAYWFNNIFDTTLNRKHRLELVRVPYIEILW